MQLILGFSCVSVSRRLLGILVSVVILVAAVATAWIVPLVGRMATQTEASAQKTDEPLLTMSGKVSDAQPVSYIRSEEFVAKGKEVRIVFRIWANQEINATIEVVRIAGYCVNRDRFGETHSKRVFGGYPNTILNHTTWDSSNEYSAILYGSLESVPASLQGRTPMFLEVEIFVESPRSSHNPTFLINWEIVVYDAP